MSYDTRRDDFFGSHGYRVLRFWNGNVVSNTDDVLSTIFEALHRKDMVGRFD